jgi:succinate dehydrogenase/fumarate reductase flavoprotein subunit
MAAAAACRPIAARSLRAVPRFDGEADVIVVGFGGAGAAAAIAARAAGGSVLVLERAPSGGGTSALAGGLLYFGGGTPLQRACGYEDSPEEMFKYLMAACGPAPDEQKVRVFSERSREHYDWIVAQGVSFKASFSPTLSLPLTDDGLAYSGSELAYPFCELATPAPRGHKPRAAGDGGGALLMEKLMAAARGAGATIVPQALGEALVRDADGRVVGVTARLDGEPRTFRARRGVVLAAGGFCHNRAMVERYAPLYLACDTPIGCLGDDGRGIRMGMGAGGAAVRMDAGFAALPYFPPEKLIEGLLVNRHGQRFINEDSYYGRTGDAIIRHQDATAILVLDAACTLASKYVQLSLIAEAPTVRVLEARLGLPAPALQSTVDLYNRYAGRGDDPLFHKRADFVRPLDVPPFRAYDCSAARVYYPFFTLGGLHTRVDGEVLDAEGAPVPGLYAAGRTTSGVSALGYSSGISLADATLFGRLAGRSAATA